MLIILLFLAWGTHSIFQGLSDAWVSRLGFDPQDFWSFRWDRLILSAMVTNGGLVFWFALLMVTLTSGVIEWIDKSGWAMVAFWGVHLVSLTLESLVFLFPVNQLGFTAILIFLITSIFLPGGPGERQAVKLSADMIHLIAFPLGFVLANLRGGKSVAVSRKANG
jgi:hypothetical protein